MEIPDEAIDKADIWAGQIPRGDLTDALYKAAPLIVAAELTNLADTMSERTVTEEDVRARIAQILGEDGWCNCQAVFGTVNYPGPWHPTGDTPSCPAVSSRPRWAAAGPLS